MTDVMFKQPSRKRAGTLTYAVPTEPAQRAKVSSVEQPNAESFVFPQQNDALPNNILDQTERHGAAVPRINTTNSVTITSPKISSARIMNLARPRFGTPHPCAESPFSVQAQPGSTPKNKHLQRITPHSENVVDISPEQHPSSRPGIAPLPSPPRSHTNIPTLMSCSPPLTANNLPASPISPLSPCSSLSSIHIPATPHTSLASSISPWPSMSSDCTTAYSPISPMPPTPVSPNTDTNTNTVFDSAAASMQRLLMADDLGMTVEDIKELNDFAASQSQKRSGRVLVRKNPMTRRPNSQRRISKADSRKSTNRASRGSRGSVARSSTEVHCPTQADGQGQAQTWWREVNWSRFSDSTSAASTLSSGDPASRRSSKQSLQRNDSFDIDAGLRIDSQDESDGDDCMKIDRSSLYLSHSPMYLGNGRPRQWLDLTGSVPEKVGTTDCGESRGALC